MTIKGFLKYILCRSCVYFTLIMLAYIVIAAIVNVSETLLLEAGRTVLFFVFSALLATAGGILSIKSFNGAVRVISHYLITLLAFYLCFLLGLDLLPSGTLIGIVAFTAVYALIMGLSSAIKAKYRKNAEVSEEYKSQFSTKKK